MTVPGWRENPELWGTAWMGGHRLPGSVKISGGLETDIDAKKSKGADQATITDNGVQPASLDMMWRFLREHWPEVQRICRDIYPPNPGGKRKPVEIKHARTDFLDIHSVYIRYLSTPDLERWIGTLSMRLLQWVPQPKPARPQTKQVQSEVQRTPEGPGTFVTLLSSPTPAGVNGLGGTGPNGVFTQADQDFTDFLQNAI